MKEWWSRRSRNQKLLIVAAGLVIVAAAGIDSENDADSIAAGNTTIVPTADEANETGVTTTTGRTEPSEASTTTTEPESESSQAGRCVREGNSMLVDASCFPDDPWPLSVQEGTLICHEVDAVTFTGDEGVYAVNGMAMGREIGEDIDPIWLDNPALEGMKINIGPLIDLGLTLCE